MYTFVGIDPGLSGGIAFLTAHGAIKSLWKMPADKNGLLVPEIIDLLKTEPILLVAIENAETRVSLHPTSVLTTGRNYGILLGILATLGLTTILVRPATWTKYMCGHQDRNLDPKEKAYLTACEMFPKDVPRFTPQRCRVPHDGIIDALLIAEFGRTQGGIA